MTTDSEANPLLNLPARAGSSPALQIMLDDKLFERAKLMAKYISDAEGFVPPHLIRKPEACFAVVTRAITWKLDPYAVAMSTYQTPGGRVGFEGKLCQAILENSGMLVGPVEYEHYGSVTVKMKDNSVRTYRSNDPEIDKVLEMPGTTVTERKQWSAVQGKFEIKESAKSGKPYAAATWTDEDAKGLGVTVRAQVRGEVKKRSWDFDLIQAFPRNSTLWATDPKTQICYTAVRRFGSVAAPGLFMGVPFDWEDVDPAMRARDVTPPRPQRSDYQETVDLAKDEPALFAITSADGEVVHENMNVGNFASTLAEMVARAESADEVHGLASNNAEDIERALPLLDASSREEFEHCFTRRIEALEGTPRQRGPEAGGASSHTSPPATGEQDDPAAGAAVVTQDGPVDLPKLGARPDAKDIAAWLTVARGNVRFMDAAGIAAFRQAWGTMLDKLERPRDDGTESPHAKSAAGLKRAIEDREASF